MPKEEKDSLSKKEETSIIISSEMPTKIGRPSKYTPQIAERWLEVRKNGSSIAQAMLLCDIKSWDTYKSWQKEYPDFKAAVEYGDIVSQAGWEQIGEAGIKGEIEKFNASTYIFMMCNRFPGQFKQQNHGGVNVQVNNLVKEEIADMTDEQIRIKGLELAQKLLSSKKDESE